MTNLANLTLDVNGLEILSPDRFSGVLEQYILTGDLKAVLPGDLESELPDYLDLAGLPSNLEDDIDLSGLPSSLTGGIELALHGDIDRSLSPMAALNKIW